MQTEIESPKGGDRGEREGYQSRGWALSTSDSKDYVGVALAHRLPVRPSAGLDHVPSIGVVFFPPTNPQKSRCGPAIDINSIQLLLGRHSPPYLPEYTYSSFILAAKTLSVYALNRHHGEHAQADAKAAICMLHLLPTQKKMPRSIKTDKFDSTEGKSLPTLPHPCSEVSCIQLQHGTYSSEQSSYKIKSSKSDQQDKPQNTNPR